MIYFGYDLVRIGRSQKYAGLEAVISLKDEYHILSGYF